MIKPKAVIEKSEAKPKRGHYRQKECPYCHTHVGNLGNHIRMKHPAERPPVEITKESLVSGEKPAPVEKGDPVFYCNDCHAELRKGENPCWNCGKFLNWSGIENA